MNQSASEWGWKQQKDLGSLLRHNGSTGAPDIWRAASLPQWKWVQKMWKEKGDKAEFLKCPSFEHHLCAGIWGRPLGRGHLSARPVGLGFSCLLPATSGAVARARPHSAIIGGTQTLKVLLRIRTFQFPLTGGSAVAGQEGLSRGPAPSGEPASHHASLVQLERRFPVWDKQSHPDPEHELRHH